jgi:predicted ferric reductase
MTDEALWALGRGTGVVALAFSTVAVILGIVTRSGRRLLGLPRFAASDVHRFAALAGMLLVVLHVTLLTLDPYAQLRLVDLLVPFLGAYRPLWLGCGTLALDVFAVLISTSLLRHRLGARTFRIVHWAAYAMWPLALAHALGNGTDAGHGWFLGLTAGCTLAAVGALGWRVRSDFVEFSDTRTREYR